MSDLSVSSISSSVNNNEKTQVKTDSETKSSSESIFAKFDVNGDSSLSLDEANSLMNDSSISSVDKESVLSSKSEFNYETLYQNSQNKLPNGKVDGDYKQGDIGDCWLLSGVTSLANSDKGAQILDDALTKLPNGDVEVKLNGVEESYVISKAELDSNKDYSSGDLDVRAIEIAADKYYSENPTKYPQYLKGKEAEISFSSIEEGSPAAAAYELLLGSDGYDINQHDVKDLSSEELDNIIKSDLILSASSNDNLMIKLGLVNAEDIETGSKEKLYQNHGYSLINSDEEFVYLINPHDSSKTLKMDIDKFKKNFGFISSVEIK